MRANVLALTLLATSTTLLISSAAQAKRPAEDLFMKEAAAATPIESAEEMSALLWAQEDQCAGLKSDLLQRQCAGVRDANRAQILSKTYLVNAPSRAIVSVVDKDSKTVQTTMFSCVLCDSSPFSVVGEGKHALVDGQWQGAELGSAKTVLKTDKELAAWPLYIGSRLKGQFLVKFLGGKSRIAGSSPIAFSVKVVGFRLYDPCEGKVMLSTPYSLRGPVDESTCDSEPKEPVKVIAKPVVADSLKAAQIKLALGKVKKQAKKCHEIYGIEGRAQFKLLIGGDGTLKNADQLGDFAGTPTGICLDKAMSTVHFPKTKKKETPITYPIVLR